jgi:hypothetical protein
LVEVRCVGNPDDAAVVRFQADSVATLATCVAQTKGPAVAVCDFRAAQLLRPGVAEKIIDLMRRDNRSVERSAILLAKSATFTLQITRLLREATSESRRRVFTEVEPLFGWLDEVLTQDERDRVRKCIAELDPSLPGGGLERSTPMGLSATEPPPEPEPPRPLRPRLRSR